MYLTMYPWFLFVFVMLKEFIQKYINNRSAEVNFFYGGYGGIVIKNMLK